MNTWSYNIKFPTNLYKRVNNIDEYYNSILELLNPIYVEGLFYGELISGIITPLDIDEWNELFSKESVNINNLKITPDNIILKPSENEFPLLLNFSYNHKYLFWTSLSNII